MYAGVGPSLAKSNKLWIFWFSRSLVDLLGSERFALYFQVLCASELQLGNPAGLDRRQELMDALVPYLFDVVAAL